MKFAKGSGNTFEAVIMCRGENAFMKKLYMLKKKVQN